MSKGGDTWVLLTDASTKPIYNKCESDWLIPRQEFPSEISSLKRYWKFSGLLFMSQNMAYLMDWVQARRRQQLEAVGLLWGDAMAALCFRRLQWPCCRARLGPEARNAAQQLCERGVRKNNMRETTLQTPRLVKKEGEEEGAAGQPELEHGLRGGGQRAWRTANTRQPLW